MRSHELAQSRAVNSRHAKIIELKNKIKPATGKHRALWVQTASGAPFDLTAQDEKQVSINDIAAHLAKICRFAGATTTFYSVAQHSVIVSHALKKYGPMAELLGLLHDAHEAYTGDISRPVKNLLASVMAYDALADLQHIVQKTILRALRLPEEPDARIAAAIAAADDAVLASELLFTMAKPWRDWGLEVPPLKTPIIPWAWPKAEEKFLERYHDLCIAAATGLGVA